VTQAIEVESEGGVKHSGLSRFSLLFAKIQSKPTRTHHCLKLKRC